MQVLSLRDLCLLICFARRLPKNEALELLRINFAIAIVFTDIPAKEVEKHVTIAGYWIFVRQEEDGH